MNTVFNISEYLKLQLYLLVFSVCGVSAAAKVQWIFVIISYEISDNGAKFIQFISFSISCPD